MKRAKYKEKPLSFMEFAEKFSTEEACRQRVFEARWPEGFVCPKCGGTKCCFRATQNAYQCNKCKHKTSPKVGTLMEKSPLPYKNWLPMVPVTARFSALYDGQFVLSPRERRGAVGGTNG